MGGCHFNRKIDELIMKAGYKIRTLKTETWKGLQLLHTYIEAMQSKINIYYYIPISYKN